MLKPAAFWKMPERSSNTGLSSFRAGSSTIRSIRSGGISSYSPARETRYFINLYMMRFTSIPAPARLISSTRKPGGKIPEPQRNADTFPQRSASALGRDRRGSLQAWQEGGARDAFTRASAKVEELGCRYQQPALAINKLQEFDQILKPING
jgi:hypothetical protein